MTRELEGAIAALDVVVDRLRARVRERIGGDGDLDRHQLAAHALAHMAADVEAARRVTEWAREHGETEERIAGAFVGDVCRSIAGGCVDLGACDRVSLEDAGLTRDDLAAVPRSISHAASGDAIVALARGGFGAPGPAGGAFDSLRAEMRRFALREIAPIAQRIHVRDELVPMSLVGAMGALGVFGTTIPEAYGGGSQSRVAMCVVTEEIARASLGVGSLATRSEIAADLVLGAGTEEQKRALLPGIASGAILPTAVFTEPDFGSDLAHVRTRAERQGDGSWRLYGQKTWITHAARADLMTVLARTRPGDDGHGGLSMFLARKSRDDRGFVDAGLAGAEIPVLGYRGMKEYELSFDGFRVEGDALLGGAEGEGFRQLMRTFETARIQTAARAVGVAQAALDEAVRYAGQRRQFGRAIADFPRVAHKIGRAIARVAAARAVTLHAARCKDAGRRCDLEAGMAKLVATRAAWEVADAAVQIHGGNGYAQEFTVSRLLVDARVLSIFEGSNEIQANVIARRLIE